MSRQIVLDTETTGLETSQGHRIIEIGCVEVSERSLTGRHFHVYINPEREVEDSAVAVHGLDNDFLADKPVFAAIVEEFLDFIRGGELIIHNAAFDVGFIDHELNLLGTVKERVADICTVTDTLAMARRKHPGQKNTLDALCKRYMVDNSQRDLHGALLDAEILAEVYLAMTGGQTALSLDSSGGEDDSVSGIRRLPAGRPALKVVGASVAEREAHQVFLETVRKATGEALWDRIDADA